MAERRPDRGRSKKPSVQDTILAVASQRKTFKTSDVLAALHWRFSRQYIHAAIKRLVHAGALIKGGATRGAFYALPERAADFGFRIRKRLRNNALREDEVLDALRARAPFLRGLRGNADEIFTYAFSEMMNNAIEHSQSPAIEIEVSKDRDKLTFAVNDFGVGVFKNIMEKRHLDSEFEAIEDLLKGKTTTQPVGHSGEGIFFTSKVGDVFVLESHGQRLTVDNTIGDFFVEEVKPSKKGTRVFFSFRETSARRLGDIFRKYQVSPSEPAFDRSEVQVRLYTRGTKYISRSQARRLTSGLEKFRSVVLDFRGVDTVGQAFADEVFRVFRQRHPETQIEAINMSEVVKFMVMRASGGRTQ